jgi:alkylation response protein AidB-like acyl-CoA dehydrogenase
MTHSSPSEPTPSFLTALFDGRFAWDAISPFPQQGPADAAVGNAFEAEVLGWARTHLDPEQVELTGRLPETFVSDLRAQGLMMLQLPREHGGRGLSYFNVFRGVEAVMRWCLPAGLSIGLHHGLGAGAVLPAIPPGPLHEFIRKHLAAGHLSGWADTEPTGGTNRVAGTTATPTADGTAYLLCGEKAFIGNGPLAGLLLVSASVPGPEGPSSHVFVVDTASPGFRVRCVQELMGLRGFPIGVLAFENVRVPREQMLFPSGSANWRTPTALEPISWLGKILNPVAASLAIAKNCLAWTQEFVVSRRINGQSIVEHPYVRRLVAEMAAEVFTLDSVIHYSLLGVDAANLADRHVEMAAAKNITSTACARIVDRTVAVFGAEGFESAATKSKRGALPIPVERAYRDARGLRISGGVDFYIDYKIAQCHLWPRYHPTCANAAALRAACPEPPADSSLSARNQAHLAYVARSVHRFGGRCLDSVEGQSGSPGPDDRQQILVALNQIASELFAMSLTLARARTLSERGDANANALADLSCTAARQRLLPLWDQVSSDEEIAELDALSTAVLSRRA